MYTFPKNHHHYSKIKQPLHQPNNQQPLREGTQEQDYEVLKKFEVKSAPHITTNRQTVDLSNGRYHDISHFTEQDFHSVTELILANNRLEGIDLCLSRLSNLTRLDLSQTELSECPQLGSLRSLTYLDVSNNNLNDLDFKITRSSTDRPFTLIASCNSISKLSKSIEKIGSLQTLDLSDNTLRSISRLSLPNLTILDLSMNKLQTVLDLTGFPGLLTLKLKDNKFTGTFPVDLASISGLEEIDLAENGISSISFTTQMLPKLKRLSLYDNNIMELPIPFITSNTTALQMLDISCNKIKWLENGLVEYFESRSLIESENPFDAQETVEERPASNLLGTIPCHSCGRFIDQSNRVFYVVIKSCSRINTPKRVAYICCSRVCAKLAAPSLHQSTQPQTSPRPVSKSPVIDKTSVEKRSPTSNESAQVTLEELKQKYGPQKKQASSSMKQQISPKEYQPSSAQYYCKVCDMEMNSLQTYNLHLEGRKHQKKVGELEVGSSAYFCKLCGVQCTGQSNYEEHIQGRTHLQKERRQQKITQESIPNTPQIRSNSQVFASNPYYCQICNVECSGPENYERHLEGKKHLKIAQRVSQQQKEAKSIEEIIEEKVTKKLNELQMQNSSTSSMNMIEPYSLFSQNPFFVTASASSRPQESEKKAIYKSTKENPPSEYVALDFDFNSIYRKRQTSNSPPQQQPTVNVLQQPQAETFTMLPQSYSTTQDDLNDDYYCAVCDLRCTGQETLDQHLKGRKHEKKIAEQNALKLREVRGVGLTTIVKQSTKEEQEIDYTRAIQIVEHIYEKLYKMKPEFTDIITGPSHSPAFESRLTIPATANSRKKIMTGIGTTKVQARREVARHVIDDFKDNGNLFYLVPERLLYKRK